MAVRVVRAGIEDIDGAASLFDAYRQFYGQPPDLEGARRFLLERLRNDESVIFLAVEQNGAEARCAGFTQLYPSFTSTGLAPIWILNDLFVAPGCRRQGVGLRLMDAAREFAVAAGAARLSLATARDNHAARALYESLGYRMDDQFDHFNLVL